MADKITNPEELVQFALHHSDNRDPVAIFGASNAKDENQLKRSYKKIALRLHPDKNHHKDAGKAFQIIQSTFEMALEAISDPQAAAQQRAQQEQQRQEAEQAAANADAQAKYEEEMREYERQMAEYEEAKRAAKAAKKEAKRQKEMQQQQGFSYAPPPTAEDLNEFPLPPEVFGNGEEQQQQQNQPQQQQQQRGPLPNLDDDWENDPADFASAQKAKKSKTDGPPPPPPPRTTRQAPPPPPPRQQRNGWTNEEPEATPKVKKSKKAKYVEEEDVAPLPNMDLSSEDEIEALEKEIARQKRKEKKKKLAAGGLNLMSLSDSEEDDDAMSKKKAKNKEAEKAMKAREKQEQLAAEEVAKQKKSAQSLASLFGKFGISMEEEEDDFFAPEKKDKKPKTSSRQSPPPAGQMRQRTTTLTGKSGTSSAVSSPLYGSPSEATAPPVKVKKCKMQCPNCMNPVSYTDASLAALCRNCNKYFIPAQVVAPPAAGGGKALAARCKCGAAKKGTCFLCGA